MIIYRDKTFADIGRYLKTNAKLAGRWVKNNKVKAALGTAAAVGGSVYAKTHTKDEIKEKLHKATDYVVDNPKDTAAYVAGELILPGILAKKALKKWPTGKGKLVAGGLGLYASSPVGLVSLGIAAKNKRQEKKRLAAEQQTVNNTNP